MKLFKRALLLLLIIGLAGMLFFGMRFIQVTEAGPALLWWSMAFTAIFINSFALRWSIVGHDTIPKLSLLLYLLLTVFALILAAFPLLLPTFTSAWIGTEMFFIGTIITNFIQLGGPTKIARLIILIAAGFSGLIVFLKIENPTTYLIASLLIIIGFLAGFATVFRHRSAD